MGDLKGKRTRTLATFLFELHGKYLPVGGIPDDHFVPDMMFNGHRVDPAHGGSIRNLHSRLREGARGTDVLEGPSTSIGYLQTGILAVPFSVQIRVGCARIVINLHSRSVGIGCPMTSKQADIVQHGISPGHPRQSPVESRLSCPCLRRRMSTDQPGPIKPPLNHSVEPHKSIAHGPAWLLPGGKASLWDACSALLFASGRLRGKGSPGSESNASVSRVWEVCISEDCRIIQ